MTVFQRESCTIYRTHTLTQSFSVILNRDFRVILSLLLNIEPLGVLVGFDCAVVTPFLSQFLDSPCKNTKLFYGSLS